MGVLPSPSRSCCSSNGLVYDARHPCLHAWSLGITILQFAGRTSENRHVLEEIVIRNLALFPQLAYFHKGFKLLVRRNVRLDFQNVRRQFQVSEIDVPTPFVPTFHVDVAPHVVRFAQLDVLPCPAVG